MELKLFFAPGSILVQSSKYFSSLVVMSQREGVAHLRGFQLVQKLRCNIIYLIQLMATKKAGVLTKIKGEGVDKEMTEGRGRNLDLCLN